MMIFGKKKISAEFTACPKCEKYGHWTIFSEKDKRFWQCDSCGHTIYKKDIVGDGL